MLTALATAQDRAGKDLALFFAVSDYKENEWTRLSGPVPNANRIATLLRDDYGFETRVVPNPNRTNIYSVLTEYTNRNYAEDSQLLIFFAGHGNLDQFRTGFFAPAGAKKNDPTGDSYITYQRIAEIVERIPCKHILLVIDACYSGYILQDFYGYQNAFGARPGEGTESARNRLIAEAMKGKTRLILTSGGEERTPDPSEFAKGIIEALQQGGGSLRILSVTDELYGNYLSQRQPKPKRGKFGSHGSGDFLFIRKTQFVPPPPDNNEQLYALAIKDGNAAFAKKDWQEAKQEYNLALKYKPGDMEALGKIKACDRELSNPNGNLNGNQRTPDLPRNYTETINGVSFTMIYVEGGTFQMGDTFNEGGSDEDPHQVTLDGYHLGQTEVTQALWQAVMRSNPSHFENCPQCPVEEVSWDDAQAFIQKLNQFTGKTYRLPTEAEWEYAARERGRKVRFGNGQNVLRSSEANFDAGKDYKQPYSEVGEYRVQTVPVKTFAPNALGLYDMAGNVWEWCADWYGSDYYKNSPSSNPPGPDSGTRRVFRGGSWYGNPQYARAASRYYYTPTYRGLNVGFRLVSL
jgi:formylglycine-generating enzyme required for sulfatase activity